jgi:phosphate transport system permease protein
MSELNDGKPVKCRKGLVTRTEKGLFRLATLDAEFGAPIPVVPDSPVASVDYTKGPAGPVFCALTEDGQTEDSTYTLHLRKFLKHNPTTDEDVYKAGRLKLPKHEGKGQPKFMLMSGLGDSVYVAWDDGYLLRVRIFSPEDIQVVERMHLLGDPPQAKLTALQFLIGKTTLMAGDSRGQLHAWFTTHATPAHGDDDLTLTMAHSLPPASSAVVALNPSTRTRMLAAGYADGGIRVFEVTTENMLVQAAAESGKAPSQVMLSPRDNAILAINSDGLARWNFDPAHPEATVRTLFLPVWYEGANKPEHVWQAAGGEDAFEPKFGMTPLIYGTLKATFYAMLMGVPLALLAAVYTSEFMHPRVRTIVKPSIELMAGLPSVVLGFLAASIFAPFFESHLTAGLALLLTLPLSFVIGGHLWQLVPESRRTILARWRILFIVLCLPAALLSAIIVGPAIEKLLFRDETGTPNFRGWLDGNWGSGASGWIVLLLPVCAVIVLFAIAQSINPRLDTLARHWSRRRNAWVALGKFGGASVCTIVLAFCLAHLLSACGLDPRGPLVGTYVQKNSLVVGFAMGFAIIPIIYTIADDALTAVPAHLRSASLGCGATTWQTAIRVVLPTAASGLFSAVMIGLGRAVGETMIVLMAAGGTPIMDINPFNGFRTLSVNLATEIMAPPEGSTHYRVLFVAALVLFGMTFLVNTLAETVRLRFRKRALQL